MSSVSLDLGLNCPLIFFQQGFSFYFVLKTGDLVWLEFVLHNFTFMHFRKLELSSLNSGGIFTCNMQ